MGPSVRITFHRAWSEQSAWCRELREACARGEGACLLDVVGLVRHCDYERGAGLADEYHVLHSHDVGAEAASVQGTLLTATLSACGGGGVHPLSGAAPLLVFFVFVL